MFLLILTLLFSACQLNSDVTTTNVPNLPTSAVLLLTPTPVPADPIPNAAAALDTGDYDNARTLYTTAVNIQVTHCAALYGLGVTNLRAGKPADAETALTQLLMDCPPSAQNILQSFRAYVQRGEARRALGNAAGAINDYGQAIALRPGVIDSYLYERMAIALTSPNGPTDPASYVQFLQKAADAPRYLAGTFGLRDELAQSLNDPASAVQQYDLILAQATNANYRAQVEVEAGNALLKIAQSAAAQAVPQSNPTQAVSPTAPPAVQTALAGQFALAFARYRVVLSTYPDAPAALDALIALVNNNQTVDTLLRTKINVANGNYAPVVSYLPGYLSATPANQIPATLYLWLGQAQRGVGNNDQALVAFQKVRDAYPSDPLASAAALEQGRTYFTEKNYPAAITAYLAVATAYPKSADTPEALWRAGYIAQTFGDPNQAVTIYDQLGTQYPGTDRAKQGSFSAGMILAPSNPTRAAALFGRAGDAHGLLWQGKMLQKTGNATAARQAWMAAEGQAPGTFFSLRAHDLLNNLPPYPAANLHIPTSSDAERTAAETWVLQTFKLPAASTSLAPNLAIDGRLTRGTELWALGWEAEARAEFDALHQANLNNPLALYQLAVYWHGIGANSASLIAATRVIRLANQPASAVPPYLARLAYPIAYANLLIAAAQQYKVDPLYFASLIRLESNFDAQAHSISDARGLTQIIPSTAQDIVTRLGWPPNFTVDDLYRPVISLPLGAYYVDFVRRYLGGNAAATLAGYNAGPGAALNWLQQAEKATGGADDIDWLYETIDSQQAEDYIQYTYENNAMYRLLYGG
ncbi:MAG: lytic transglycosylase domain-containing protein [Aggregatilineales bacterium]